MSRKRQRRNGALKRKKAAVRSLYMRRFNRVMRWAERVLRVWNGANEGLEKFAGNMAKVTVCAVVLMTAMAPSYTAGIVKQYGPEIRSGLGLEA